MKGDSHTPGPRYQALIELLRTAESLRNPREASKSGSGPVIVRGCHKNSRSEPFSGQAFGELTAKQFGAGSVSVMGM